MDVDTDASMASMPVLTPDRPNEDAMDIDTFASMAVLSPAAPIEDAMNIDTEASTTVLPRGGFPGTTTRWYFFGVPDTRGE
jgi:hypothetical protein